MDKGFLRPNVFADIQLTDGTCGRRDILFLPLYKNSNHICHSNFCFMWDQYRLLPKYGMKWPMRERGPICGLICLGNESCEHWPLCSLVLELYARSSDLGETTFVLYYTQVAYLFKPEFPVLKSRSINSLLEPYIRCTLRKIITYFYIQLIKKTKHL